MPAKVPDLDIDKQLGPITLHGKMERRVIFNLLNHIKSAGFGYSIYDGEEHTKTPTVKDAMELIFNLDECWIITHPGRHYIRIVLGNRDLEDIIADWSYHKDDRDGFNALMEKFDPSNFV